MLSHSICISTETKFDEFMAPSIRIAATMLRPSKTTQKVRPETPSGGFVSGKPVDHRPQEGAGDDGEQGDPCRTGKGHPERAAEARFVGGIVGRLRREIVFVHGAFLCPERIAQLVP